MGKRLIAATLLPLSVAAMLAGCKLVSKPGDQQGAPTASASATPTPSATATPTTSVNWVPDAPNPSVNLALDPLPTQPGDVPDSHDVAFLKRFKGAAIIGYVSRPYDKLTFYDANESADPGPHTLPVEGPVTRIVYRIFESSTMQDVGREASQLAIDGVKDSANNVSCADGCEKIISHTISHKTLSEEAHRIWWTFFILVECHVRYEASLTVECVVRS